MRPALSLRFRFDWHFLVGFLLGAVVQRMGWIEAAAALVQRAMTWAWS